MGSRQCRSMLVIGLSDEDECRSMLRWFCQLTAHSFSERNDGEVYLPHQEWLCSTASSECALVVSGGLAEGLGYGMSALRQATSIFGICTRYVRGARRSMGAEVVDQWRSLSVDRWQDQFDDRC
ncbi:hypothetical protein F2Q70_00029581 [Brassica cretica]|uniref:Uncharacterized protein n=1 Tax=Brassica cretica TaxID=69181 RepID=A0A8S9FJZ9_BRACR|nr:hypothetical protein F2Q70_00029581 [Brassica cretica]